MKDAGGPDACGGSVDVAVAALDRLGSGSAGRLAEPYLETRDVMDAITSAALSKAASRSVMPWRRAMA